MAGYYIRDCRSFSDIEILNALIKQEYGLFSRHEFDCILFKDDLSLNNVILYDSILRPIYCSDGNLKNFIECVENLKEIFIEQDKVFLGEV